MILVIGGYAQGQLDYVRATYKVREQDIYSGQMPSQVRDTPRDRDVNPVFARQSTEHGETWIVIDKFNEWAIRELHAGREPMDAIRRLIERYPNCILISDEIGNGIVPVEESARNIRDAVGGLQVKMAEQADEVIRVICGLGQKIK